MGRVAVLVVSALLVVGPVAAVPVFGAVTGMTQEPAGDATPLSALPESNTSDSGVGTRFVGVVEAHGTAHHRAVAEARVRLRLSLADSRTERGTLVEGIYRRLEERVEILDSRIAYLSTGLENGSISPAVYRVRRASITVELRSIQRITTRLEATAADISIGLLPGVDISVADIESLHSQAVALEGEVLSTIAPSFGSNTSTTPDSTTTSTTTLVAVTTTTTTSIDVEAVIGDAESRVQTAQDRVATMRETLSGVLVTDRLATLRDQATANLSLAEQHLADARDAQAAGDDERAVALARDAIEYADLAIRYADDAIELATA